jgi:magnesium transporter
MTRDKIHYADDDKEPVRRLLLLRIPSLGVGLLLGLILSFITSSFGEVLSQNISLAFFLPFVVYLADAVGAQTQAIYVRDLKSRKADFKVYLLKESILGVIFGLLFSVLTAVIVSVWFNSIELAIAISLGVLGAVFSAPIIALVTSEILQLEREDPAVWSGPIATVIQDAVSVLIYGFVASTILL